MTASNNPTKRQPSKLLLRGQAHERWLNGEVATAYDALRAEPERGVSAAHVCAALVAEHALEIKMSLARVSKMPKKAVKGPD